MTKKNDKEKKQKEKLPFAVFICPKSNIGDVQDYKQVFTDIISDRIKQDKFKRNSVVRNFRTTELRKE